MSTQPATDIRSTGPRLVSMDAYRGLVMLAIASSALGIPQVAKQFSASPTWQAAAYQFEHVAWTGCSFWDLIQPSFMFMVGVSMAFSYAKRQRLGQSYAQLLGHATVRAIVLVLLGIFLSSNWSRQTNFTFVNVLTQIGLGYVFLFLLWNRPRWVQWTAATGILVGYWALFAFYPLPGADFDYQSVGLPDDWPLMTGLAAHWNKNANVAADFDLWFLNLFPRPEVFRFNSGGYQTLNFIPSLATMIFGLMAGELMRSERYASSKLGWLVAAGLGGLAVGYGLHAAGVCPLVKRIWTPSWTLFSTGWTCLMLAAFYAVIDVGKQRWWAFPLTVVGMNSITMYVMSQLLKPWTRDSLQIHLGSEYSQAFGSVYAPMFEAIAVVTVLWLICYWLYRQKVFLRI